MNIERAKIILTIFKKFNERAPIRRETSKFLLKNWQKNHDASEARMKMNLFLLYISTIDNRLLVRYNRLN